MDALARRALTGLIFLVGVMAGLLFLPAWTIRYWQGWAYWLLFTLSVLIITAHFLKTDRDLIERRLTAGPVGEKRTAQRIIQLLASLAFCSLLALPSLDHRFGWSTVPTALVIAGDVLSLVSFVVIFLVFRENTYTSGTIEVAREQRVIATGPYGVVRHPMYAGALILFVATPLALGSWWALLITIPMTFVLVLRLLDEEQFLVGNLAGYAEYRERTTHRLIPGIW